MNIIRFVSLILVISGLVIGDNLELLQVINILKEESRL
jgi:hypothetical protein